MSVPDQDNFDTDLPHSQEDPHGGPAEDVAHVHDGDDDVLPGHTDNDSVLVTIPSLLSEICLGS